MTSAVAALPSQKFLKNKFPFSNASLDPLVKCSATSPSLTHVKLVKKILSENITERLPSSPHTQRLLVRQSQLTFPGGNFSNIFIWWLASWQVGQIYSYAHTNIALERIIHSNVHNSRLLEKAQPRLTQLSRKLVKQHWLLREVG